MSSERAAPLIWDTIERYFDLLQAHAPAERMRDEILTDDFRTGFVDGLIWQGEQGLRNFLGARAEFFDESHTVEQMSTPERLPDGRWRAHTRLEFFLRHRLDGSPVSDTFTGKAFHLWEFAPGAGRSGDGTDMDWRVAAQLVEGFASLDDNARRLFSRPTNGLNLDDR
ncbi:hypothetical protein OG883_37905 [Streptomyces sp. NBC_01142]|uniref:hypothetical protein n=1 Tax=Streptomyces sp. NBC_01142 TaxID=2975865 RepID=UPI002253659D|nr:hypothetical protein [Streptomyces sp. NBC_01142]MCX4825532.1 hypothetical protein [Streptomyces sp. NBC_01142]